MDSRTRIWLGQAFEHEADHCEADESGDGSGVTLEVASEATVATDPGECSLDNPALGQDFETSGGDGPLDDLDCPTTGSCCRCADLRSPIAAVAMDEFNERKQTTGASVEHQRDPVAILDAGGMDGHVQ